MTKNITLLIAFWTLFALQYCKAQSLDSGYVIFYTFLHDNRLLDSTVYPIESSMKIVAQTPVYTDSNCGFSVIKFGVYSPHAKPFFAISYHNDLPHPFYDKDFGDLVMEIEIFLASKNCAQEPTVKLKMYLTITKALETYYDNAIKSQER